MMNPELNLLQPYPFEKLRLLLDGTSPADLPAVSLSIGEPKHPAPQFVLDTLTEALRDLEVYPSTRGSVALRKSIASWLCNRFKLANPESLAAHNVISVNGTREGLFAIAQVLLDRNQKQRSVLMPNPFYQIYEGAALLAGCTPDFYTIDENADANIKAITDAQFAHCQMIYICTPGNPTGAVLSQNALQWLIDKAHEHDFVIISDECYSEIYRQADGAPCGLLQAAHANGNEAFNRCLVFHSLSKRSNLPGLRSGFAAGDKTLIEKFVKYRTYHGCSMPGPIQKASSVAWNDETHVAENRRDYDEKYAAVLSILKPVMQVATPPAGFYLWPQLALDDQQFTQRLLAKQNVRVVPGSYLARVDETTGINPGSKHIRLALVASLDDCITAARRIVNSI